MRASRSHRTLLATLANAAPVGILGAILWIGFERAARVREAEQIRLPLPRLPDTEGWPEAFTEALRQADSNISRGEEALANAMRLAILLHANGFLEEAASCYRVLEEGEPNEPRWPYFRALIHFARGDLASGQEALESAVSLDPSAVHVLLKLGEVRFISGQLESALEAYWECLRLDTGNPYVLLGIAREKMRSAEAKGALSILADLLATTPEFAPAHMLMAQLYSRIGESPKAEASRPFPIPPSCILCWAVFSLRKGVSHRRSGTCASLWARTRTTPTRSNFSATCFCGRDMKPRRWSSFANCDGWQGSRAEPTSSPL